MPHRNARGSCPGDSGAQAVADDRGGDRGGVGDAALDDSAILNRVGLGKRSQLEPPEPPNRYERSAPGEPVHVDVKKLARFHRPGHRMLGRGPGRYDERAVGYDYVHVCVDDYSRLAYVEVLPNERATTAIAFLRWAIKWFAGHGVRVQAVMTDNGSAYRSKAHKVACVALSIRHLRTKPRRPSTNGKESVS